MQQFVTQREEYTESTYIERRLFCVSAFRTEARFSTEYNTKPCFTWDDETLENTLDNSMLALPDTSTLIRLLTFTILIHYTIQCAPIYRSQFHIFAVGTEECLNSIAKSVIVHSKKEWESRLKETLGASYEMLCGHSLQASLQLNSTP